MTTSFSNLLENSASFCHNTTFNINNIEYINKNLVPLCNCFLTSTNTDSTSIYYTNIDDFVSSLKINNNLAILCSEALTDNAANTFEQHFQPEFLQKPISDGILNFYSAQSNITGRKQLQIRTFKGSFALEEFGITTDNQIDIPERLNAPYDLIEYAGFFVIRPDFIYLSSTSSFSMKAALYVLTHNNLYEDILSNNKSILIRLRRSYKITVGEDLIPVNSNISVMPMVNLINNVP